MPLYRKQPVVIEARQLSEDNIFHLVHWMKQHGISSPPWYEGGTTRLLGLVIPTLEGDHRANIGDYIIKGIKGEFYPCKPDIFEATYSALKGGEGYGTKEEEPNLFPVHEQHRALTILNHLQMENTDWVLRLFKRWRISSEPLRHDAREFLRRHRERIRTGQTNVL